ncbi:hypothetical protein P7H17_02245 [Paenibacillus larvae]|nr:hypothetical protein [Paenibacillus larvae]MDT2285167.1 hypothetical protein [Paenibacillus larvae]
MSVLLEHLEPEQTGLEKLGAAGCDGGSVEAEPGGQMVREISRNPMANAYGLRHRMTSPIT